MGLSATTPMAKHNKNFCAAFLKAAAFYAGAGGANGCKK
jgi:hypothetical protein